MHDVVLARGSALLHEELVQVTRWGGYLLSLANVQQTGLSLLNLVPPLLIGLSHIWMAYTKHKAAEALAEHLRCHRETWCARNAHKSLPGKHARRGEQCE